MFERFTHEAREVVVRAVQVTLDAGAGTVRPEHLLAGLLADPQSAACRVLAGLGVDPAAVREDVRERTSGVAPGFDAGDSEALASLGIDLEEVLRHVGDAPRPRRRRPRFSRSAKKVLELSLRETVALRHDRIGSEHLLLGLVSEADPVVLAVLRERGVGAAELRAAVARTGRRAG